MRYSKRQQSFSEYMKQNPLIYVLISLLFASCDKPEYPIVPEITWSDFEVQYAEDENSKDSIKLVFNYLDGDGDLGLSTNQKIYLGPDEDSANAVVYIDYFEFRDGRYTRVLPIAGGGPDDTLDFEFRVPVLNKSNRPKSIKGEVSVKIKPYESPRDTLKDVMCRIKILDRAGHWSNEIQTPSIPYQSPEK